MAIKRIVDFPRHLAYTREKAAFPLDFIRESKFFPYVSKIDNGYGDRNLVCRCTE